MTFLIGGALLFSGKPQPTPFALYPGLALVLLLIPMLVSLILRLLGRGAFGRDGDASLIVAGQRPVLVRHPLGVLVLKTIVRLIGVAAVLFGLGLAGAALMSDAGELQALLGVFALAGLLIALVGGGLFVVGALFGRSTAKAAGPGLTPEQQQLLDAREFQATRREK